MNKQFAKKALVIAISVASFTLIPAALMFNGQQMDAKASQEKEITEKRQAETPVVALAKVSVLDIKPSSHQAHVHVYGEIEPTYELSLSSEVAGMIEWMSPELFGRVLC